MYGTCETLCRELAAKYPGDTPLMLVVWSPEEIQALADGMEISLTDHEIRTILARLEDIPEDQRIESGISSGVAMEIINNVSENRQVTVPAELLASLIQPQPAEKQHTRKRLMLSPPAGGDSGRTINHERKHNAERTDLSSRP